jgi:phospholipid/cholesterol/gamma-HCH transport system substrate-binding protein
VSRPPLTPLEDAEPGAAPPVPHLELKATLLLLFTVLLVAGSIVYLLYARGFFEPTQRLVLTTDDAEGVVVGMDMSFSGFPIGRVRRVELADNGNVRILIDVAQKDAHWLRTSSVFTLVRGLVGGTAIRAFSGILTDPPLPDGASRPVLRGDATAELPRVLESAREVLDNLAAITGQDGTLRASLASVQDVTAKLKGPGGALGVLFGNPADAKKVLAALDRTNALLARLDTVVGKADAQVFGPKGVVNDTQATMRELQRLLADTRASVARLDAVLMEAQGIGKNVRGATADLATLRGEVDANLRKIQGMLNELDRKWPLSRDTEVKLP